MEQEFAKLEALRAELIDTISQIGASDLGAAEKANQIEAANLEIDKIEILQMDLAATEINAATKQLVAAKIAASQNVLSKILKGLQTEVAAFRDDVKKIIRDITPDPVVLAPSNAPTPALVDPVTDNPVLLRRTEGTRAIYGHLVRQVQLALRNGGFETQGIDMIFGDDTENALLAWRASTGKDAIDAIVTRADWAELVGSNEPDLFDISAQATAAFEGHGFGKIVGDFDGAVMTWGYHGYTLKFGHLQAVLKLIEQSGPNTLNAVFGTGRADELRAMLAMTSMNDQIAWARANVLDANNAIKVDWHSQFADLGEQEVTRAAQLAHSRETFWKGMAVPQATAMGLKKPLSLGMLFDAAIQQGGASKATVKTVKDARTANPAITEMSLRAVLAQALRDQLSNSTWADDVFARRKTFISGRGQVHGANYDLGYWGFFASHDENEGRIITPRIPTITNMVPASPAQQSFVDFFNTEIRPHAPNFSAEELLYRGGSNSAGSCAGLNTDPPQELWANAIGLTKLLQAIRQEFGTPVRISSCYRSPAYNKCIGGAKGSQHKEFTAADITIADGNTALSWHKRILKMQNEGVFLGGVGKYNTFVHVDVRGFNANW
jgi:hypothetical protein